MMIAEESPTRPHHTILLLPYLVRPIRPRAYVRVENLHLPRIAYPGIEEIHVDMLA